MKTRFRKESDQAKSLRLGQEALTQFANTLPRLPELGPEFSTLGVEVADALVVHRFRSKYEKPSDSNNALRKTASINEMLDYDRSHVSLDWRQFPTIHRRTFLNAKSFLTEALRGFRPSYKFCYPSNETYVSAGGDVSLVAKLSDLSQWTVSADCIDYAFKIVWANDSLVKMVKMHFRREFPWRTLQSAWASECPEGKHIGYFVVRRMFKALCTIVGVDRLTTVPKNRRTDRVITCVPFWNMVCQLSHAEDLKNHVKVSLGYDINHLQTVQRNRISDLANSTIDLKRASDCNWWEIVKELFPKRIVDILASTRTGIVEYEGEYFPLNMMAPMGCGYTFEIMTLTLLAYGRQFDPECTVFGDDIIIASDCAPELVEFLESSGWVINRVKSFVSGKFRESCGAFFHEDVGYLVSYDFHYPEDLYDIVVICNKLRRIVIANQVGSELKSMIIVMWVKLQGLLTVGRRVPSKELDGEMLDWDFYFDSKLPLRGTDRLIAQQLQNPAVMTIQQSMHKVTTTRRPTKWEESFTQLVRLLMPGLTDLNKKETKVLLNRCDVHGQQYHGLVLYSPLTYNV